MKKLLMMTLFVVAIVVGTGLFFHPVIKEYGKTTVQYDEQTGKYFAEVTSRYEVKPTAGIKAGMPVSYYKTDGTVLQVNSKLETKEEILARIENDIKMGSIIASVICWCGGALFLWLNSDVRSDLVRKFRMLRKRLYATKKALD